MKIKILIGLFIITILITSFVVFREVAETVLEPKISNYNINIVYAPNMGLTADDLKEAGLVIGLDIDAATNEVTNEDIVPEITVGEDGNFYLAGVKTNKHADKAPEQSHVVRGTSRTLKNEDGTPKTTWYIDGEDSGVEVKETQNIDDVTIEIDEETGTYIIAGKRTNVKATGNKPVIGLTEDGLYYTIDGINTEVEKTGFGFFIREGAGYGAGFSPIGDSLISNDNKLLEKFVLLTEVLETSQDYYTTGSSNTNDQHFANKYYIKNTGTKVQYLRIHFIAFNSVNNALDAARFMLSYYDNKTEQYRYTVYAKADKDGDPEFVAKTKDTPYQYLIDYNIIDFEAKTVKYLTNDLNKAWKANVLNWNEDEGYYEAYSAVFNENNKLKDGVIAIAPGETISYTFSAWFEASDDDHNDSIKDGSISFIINYELISEDYLD